jgi:2-polyprenyl-6-methoxyphenol hydroxylase-like FAD-dependent oxidoreductase
MWLGEGKHFLTFPLRAGQLINYVGFVPADEEMKESWSMPGDPDVLRREFAGWDPRIESLLSQVSVTFRWALYDREPLPTWSRGRLTLLGDAAHPMLPHLGQGANQSIEDGMALATILARPNLKTVATALLAYEGLRRERVGLVQRGARENDHRYDSANPLFDGSSPTMTWSRKQKPPHSASDELLAEDSGDLRGNVSVGHEPTRGPVGAISALSLKADIDQSAGNVSVGP